MKNPFETPRVPEATKSQNPIYREVHENREDYEKPSITSIEATRSIVLEKYNINSKHTLTAKLEEGKRKILAFSILINKNDPEKRYYNEGYLPHALLFDTIIKTFESEIGTHDVWELDLNEWITKKGFIDPNQNGFQSFPESRQALTSTYQQNGDINGHHSTDSSEIPNWFLSGDSEKK